MKTILEALQFCKENNIYDKNINIALGKYKFVQTWEEGETQNKIKEYENNYCRA
tara:strand:- start:1038 stop:1199 length:162 start_codon:yes stop_codon:yes gene_type:complete